MEVVQSPIHQRTTFTRKLSQLPSSAANKKIQKVVDTLVVLKTVLVQLPLPNLSTVDLSPQGLLHPSLSVVAKMLVVSPVPLSRALTLQPRSSPTSLRPSLARVSTST